MGDTDILLDSIEECDELRLDFEKLAKAISKCPDIIPVAVQDVETREIILVAFTNQEALRKSIETRIATFWSTSRNELWIKGFTSGNYFDLVEIRVNCEQNSLVYIVRSRGEGICHTRNSQGIARNCYYRSLNLDIGHLDFIDK
ncbi:MAG: phosphoribosyl-AMP cyclohydrolase [Armatimonadota bacterium]